MNLPVGVLKRQTVALNSLDIAKEFESLSDAGFSGYAVATIQGADGMDEALVLFNDGLIVGTVYTYCKYDFELKGPEAVDPCFNGLAAKQGVVDVNALSHQQVELVLAFNDKVKLSAPIQKRQFRSLFKASFDESASMRLLAKVKRSEESRGDLFKRFGLGGLEGV